MTHNPQKAVSRILSAILKHQTEIWLWKNASGIASDDSIDEDLQNRLDDWLRKEEIIKQLLEAHSKANEYFLQHCGDNELKQVLSLGLESLPSLQTVVANLPTEMDSKAAKQVLQAAFARNSTGLTIQQCEYGAELYTNALLQALENIKKTVLPILVQDLWNYVSRGTNNVLLIRLMLIDISTRPLAKDSSSGFSGEMNESARANALVALAPYLSEENKKQSLSVARKFRYKIFYTRTVQALIPRVNDELKVQILTDTQKIKDEYDRACALAAIAPHLFGKFKEQALQEASFAASEIRGDQEAAYNYALGEVVRAHVLATLPQTIEDKLKGKALEEARLVEQEVGNEYPHPNDMATLASVRAMVAIIPHLSDELKEYALAKASRIRNETCRARALVALIPHLSDESKKQTLNAALVAARGIADAWARARALTILIPYLYIVPREDIQKEVLSSIREIRFLFDYASEGASLERARALAALAPYLKDERKEQALEEVLTATRKVELGYMRASIIAVLAPHLSDILKEQALTLARDIKHETERVLALADISPYLKNELKRDVQQEALSIALRITDDSQRSHALKLLAHRLNGPFVAQILAAVREFDNDSQRSNILTALAPHLPDGFKAQALAAACELYHGFSRSHALAAFAPYLNDELIEQALTAAHQIDSEYDRAYALANLAPYLNDELKVQVLQETLSLRSSEEILRIWGEIQYKGLDIQLPSYFRFMASKSQSEAIQRLSELIPALLHFSGREIANDIFRAISDTVGWQS